MLAKPKIVMRMSQYVHINKAVTWPLFTLLMTLLMTYQVFHISKIEREQKTQAYFDFRAREATNLIQQRMLAYEQVLRGVAGLFKASNSVERNEFKQYVTTLDLTNDFTGIQGVGFSLVVPAAKKNQHIASIRKEGFPEYTIYPEGQRDIYTSIIYLEPFSGRNQRAFGYDMFNEPVRHAAMQKAIDSGQAALSGKVKLIQETDKHVQAGFLMYWPVYRNGTTNNTLSERREHILGWVYAPFRMTDLMEGLLGEHATDLDIHIFDGKSMSNGALMYDSDGSNLASFELCKTFQAQIAEHVWTIHIQALPLMRSRVDDYYPELLAFIGVIISLLTSLLVWFLVTGRERAINTAKRLHSDLISERQRLHNIIEGTHIGTWEWNVQTGEIHFNEELAHIMGYELSELEPISIESWMKFVHPDDTKLSDLVLVKHFSGALAHCECEARMRHKDGHWLWILTRGKVTSWTPEGKPLWIAGTHQEITERKQVEMNLKESEARLHFILENSPIAVRVTCKRTGQVKFANQGYANLTNVALDALVGLDPKPYYANPQDYVDVMDALCKGERVDNKLIEIINFTDPAKPKWTLGSYMPITFDNEPAVLGWFYDVTDSMQTEIALRKSSAELNALIQAIPDLIWLKDTDGVYLLCNQSFERFFGAKEADIIGKTDYDFVDKAQGFFFRANDKKAILAGKPRINEEWLNFADHSYQGLFETTKTAVHASDGSVIGVLGISHDITERNIAENALRIAATAFESQEGMMVTDDKTNILRVNSAFMTITGYTSEEVISKTPALLSSGRHDKAFYKALWDSLKQTGAWEGEIWNRRKSGEVFPEHLTITAVKNPRGVVTNYVATLTDITTTKAASEAIKALAFYDPLTQLPNRRLLVDRLSQTMAASKRNKIYGALIFLDLDNFKPLNDSHGHVVGDRLLIEVAHRLISCMRDMDTVARFGGDEFVILLAGLNKNRTSTIAHTAIVAEKIRLTLAEPYRFTIHHADQPDTIIEHHCTASIGVVVFNGTESSQDEMMKWADTAMYEAKEAGRNQIKFYGEQS